MHSHASPTLFATDVLLSANQYASRSGSDTLAKMDKRDGKMSVNDCYCVGYTFTMRPGRTGNRLVKKIENGRFGSTERILRSSPSI